MPFIISYPGIIPKNVRYERPVCAIDLLPTILGLADISLPKGYVLDGVDMSGFLTGVKRGGRDRPIFWEYGSLDATFLRPGIPENMSPDLAYLKGNWKLLMDLDGSDVQLYNLGSDISETTNLVKQEEPVVKEMSRELLEWRNTIFDKRD